VDAKKLVVFFEIVSQSLLSGDFPTNHFILIRKKKTIGGLLQFAQGKNKHQMLMT
jgi:hypothetical protein